MSHEFTLRLDDEPATLGMAARFSGCLMAGLTIYMQGDLGAGKTTFVRGLIHALGFAGKVKSPTYTLVENYQLPDFMAHHFDLYRFNDPEEWDAAGFRDYFNASTVCLVEWPEKAAGLLPASDIEVALDHLPAGRQITLTAHSELGRACLEKLS